MPDSVVILNGMPFKAKDLGDGTYSLDVTAVFEPGDVQIGAVEIKDPDSDVRAEVTADGLEVHEAATPVVTPATGTGAIAVGYAPSAAFWLESVTVHLSSAPTTAGDLTATLNANDGPPYDTVLLSTDPSSPAATDIFWQPESPLLCEAGDAIDIAYANADGRTYGVRIVARLA